MHSKEIIFSAGCARAPWMKLRAMNYLQKESAARSAERIQRTRGGGEREDVISERGGGKIQMQINL